MTTLDNIMNLIPAAAPKAAQGTGLAQKSPALSDFLGMILSPADAAVAQQNLPLTQADIKSLSEKIAAMLEGHTTENNPALSSNMLQWLSAPLAGNIQHADAPLPADGMQATAADMADMAQMLNGIEPGAGAEADMDMDMDAALSLLRRQPRPAAPQTDNTVGLAQKIAALLQQHGADQASTATAATAAAIPVMTGAQGLAALQNILQLQDEDAQPQPQQHNTAGLAPTAADEASLPAPQQPAVDGKADGKPLPPAPAVTGQNGGNLQNTFGQNTFGQNGFGQNGFNQNAFAENGFTFFGADGGMTADAGNLQQITQNFAQVHAQAAAQSLPAQTTQMIAVQLQRNAAAKIDSFTLQLEPADLGRLDVELKFHRDGSVQAHLAADRPETLALLQKDAAHLERILQQAGFDTRDGALSFDLRQHADGQQAGDTGTQRAGGTGAVAATDNHEAAQNAAAETRQTGYIGLQGVNIMV